MMTQKECVKVAKHIFAKPNEPDFKDCILVAIVGSHFFLI